MKSNHHVEFDEYGIPQTHIFVWDFLKEVTIITSQDHSDEYFLLKYSIKDHKINIYHVGDDNDVVLGELLKVLNFE